VRGIVLILSVGLVLARCRGEREDRFRTVPSEQELRATLPQEPVLEFATLVRTSKEVSRGSVRFSVQLTEGGREFHVFDEVVRARTGGSAQLRRVNLAAWRGREVAILFSVEPAYPELAASWIEDVEAAWGEPRIENRTLPPPPPKPSIVLVLVDTLRRDYLGFHGFEGPISPGLDWLASESTVFENAFTQAPWTKPSIASLFTALHPDTHGLDNHEGLFGARESPRLTTGVLPASAVTLAEALKSSGYRTAAFIANPWLHDRYGFDQGFDTYEIVETLDSILERARSFARGEGPFFLYLHFMDVHGPYDAPEADFEAMTSSESLEPRAVPPPGGALPSYLQGISWFDKEDFVGRDFGEIVAFRLTRSHTARARYAANVRDFDRRFAPFLNELRSTERNDDTILVLTSDHGEELLEHGGWDHGFNLYDHQIRVPLLIRAPGAREAGRRLTGMANLVDVMPTLLRLANADPPEGLEGRDLLGTDESESATFAAATKHREGVYSVREGRYKLMRDGKTETSALFDLATDPAEYRDVAAEHVAEANRLLGVLTRHITESRRARLQTETATIPEDIRKRLEALGYLTEPKREERK
jgi:arylsulfatase A-like enzyme